MAESENSQLEEEEEEEEGPVQAQRKEIDYSKAGCPSRIEELAKPKRWLLLSTWKNYGSIFDSKRLQRVKEKVQELFSMSPEETELYFNTLRNKKPKRVNLKALRKKIRKEAAASKREANCILHLLLKNAMKYAFKHSPPLLVTPMLRIVSDHVLEILSNLHKIALPKRNDNDMLSQFLITLSDWTAIFMASIYYEIEVEERKEIERLQKLADIKSISSVTSKIENDGEENENGDSENENTEQYRFDDEGEGG